MSPGTKPPPVTVSVKEACRVSGMGPTTLYQLIKDRKLRTTKVGRRRLVIYSSLLEVLGVRPPDPPPRRPVGRPPKIRPAT